MFRSTESIRAARNSIRARPSATRRSSAESASCAEKERERERERESLMHAVLCAFDPREFDLRPLWTVHRRIFAGHPHGCLAVQAAAKSHLERGRAPRRALRGRGDRALPRCLPGPSGWRRVAEDGLLGGPPAGGGRPQAALRAVRLGVSRRRRLGEAAAGADGHAGEESQRAVRLAGGGWIVESLQQRRRESVRQAQLEFIHSRH